MKKRIKIVCIAIAFTLLIISYIIFDNKDNIRTFKQDGITYALKVDGASVTNFPAKGLYKVSVKCENAKGKWLYDEWKLTLENITGDVSCDLDFKTISKTNLNDYVISLAGSTQGAGQVVSETANIPDYTDATVLSKDFYVSPNIFSSSSHSDSSGIPVSNVFNFSDSKWTSIPSAMTTNTYYHFQFKPKENGFYQLCGNISIGNTDNKLGWYDYRRAGYYVWSASTTEAKNNLCVNMGYITTDNYIKVYQRAYTDIATTSFSIKKAPTFASYNYGIRYEGKNPNNYVWFNNELWRIIGVFDSVSHGVSGKNLVKIIRADTLDGLAWHKSLNNNWTAASLNKLLNGAYYNAQDGTDTGYCYGLSPGLTMNCDYTQKGIQSGYRGMIANVTWYLGGFLGTNETAEGFYGYERGNTVYSGRPTSTTGYVGLMYPSDYGYSVLSSSCARTTTLGSYNKTSCGGQSWLYGKGQEWTLTPSSYYGNHVFSMFSDGRVVDFLAVNGFGHRPVLYLDSTVYKIDGDGSMANPYIIGM